MTDIEIEIIFFIIPHPTESYLTCRTKGGPSQAITTPEQTQLITPLTLSTYCARKKDT